MYLKFCFHFVVQFLLLTDCADCFFNESFHGSDSEHLRILSRRKRFLVFPEGSSFQLVFCVQTSALIPIGDIFLYGQTAAIAWNLPTDPQLFHMFKDKARIAQRRGDQEKNIYYLDEDGKVIAKVPYKRKPIINPAFSKRSIEDKLTYKEKLRMKLHRPRMHEKRLKEDFLKKTRLDKRSIDFHRSSRFDLFGKIETFFSAVGQEGRRCVLYQLCVAGQPYGRQGTFLQELFRAVFTLPKGDMEEEYDRAHASSDCGTLYPGCGDLQGVAEPSFK